MKELYLFANWKMYLNHTESVALARVLRKKMPALKSKAKVAIFPSAVSLVAVRQALGPKIAVGPQNAYWVDKGGYTGEVSAAMYKQLGCTYALVGHSERRHVFHETNADVRQKLEAALSAGLTPVVCVGETARERKAGDAEEVVEAQLRSAFTNLTWPKNKKVIVAYEPVWAIGTGESCDPEEAERMANLIYKDVQGLLGKQVEPILLYGGSVRPDNVANYVGGEHLQGVLVGGASAKAATWLDIMKHARV